MITITHEGSGPYIERTILDYGGIKNHGEIPDDAAFEALVSNTDGESPDDLKERIEMLEGQLEEEEEAHQETRKDLKAAEEEIRALNDRLDESDPAQSMRQEIERLKSLNDGYLATIDRLNSEMLTAMHEARTLKADNASLKAGIVPKVERKPALCACGGTFSRRSKFHPQSKCYKCGTPKGQEPDPALIARVKAME